MINTRKMILDPYAFKVSKKVYADGVPPSDKIYTYIDNNVYIELAQQNKPQVFIDSERNHDILITTFKCLGAIALSGLVAFVYILLK